MVHRSLSSNPDSATSNYPTLYKLWAVVEAEYGRATTSLAKVIFKGVLESVGPGRLLTKMPKRPSHG